LDFFILGKGELIVRDQYQWRMIRQITQRNLARLTGLSQPKINRFETGRAIPGQKERVLICRALQIKENQIIWKGEQQMTVPRMPQMRWNKDGSPDFSHLEDGEDERQEENEQRLVNAARERVSENQGVPDMPTPKWRNGKPIQED
jgi:transcriptional regulator with XRE-family HTH domain